MSTRDTLEEAEETLLRARRGDDVSDALIEHLRAVGELPWSTEKFRVSRAIDLALFGGVSAKGVAAVIKDQLPLEDQLGPQRRLTGLLLRDGDPMGSPLPTTPWGIPKRASLEEAIAHVWGPCPDAAKLVDALQRRTLGLALFEAAERRAPQLGYLVYHERDEGEIPKDKRDARRPSFDRREALAWEPFGDLSLVVGQPPLAGTPSLRAGVSIPSPLRAFYAVHAGLRDGMWSLSGPEDLFLWYEMLDSVPSAPVRAEDPNESRRADELLSFFSYGDDMSELFDLTSDPDEPLVRTWGEGCLFAGPGQSFAEWLDERVGLFVKAADTDP